MREEGGYCHDGRFRTLDDVVAHPSGVLKLRLAGAERKGPIGLLESL